MDQIYSILMNGGLGVASFLALILLGKYILEDGRLSEPFGTGFFDESKNLVLIIYYIYSLLLILLS